MLFDGATQTAVACWQAGSVNREPGARQEGGGGGLPFPSCPALSTALVPPLSAATTQAQTFVVLTIVFRSGHCFCLLNLSLTTFGDYFIPNTKKLPKF